MRIRTITTIELSSLCNLACKYCVNRLFEREAGRKPQVMAEPVFQGVLKVLDRLVGRGTQQEVNLNGNGEPLLDKDFVRRLSQVREVMGPRGNVQFSTNGILMTRELAKQLKAAGVSQVHLSVHKPYFTRRAMHILWDERMEGTVNYLSILMSHNWAGQLEPQNSIPEERLPKLPCDPLNEGRAYVQAEGDIVPCCYDYRNLGRIGSVSDEDILEREYGTFELCKTCHQGRGNGEGALQTRAEA